MPDTTMSDSDAIDEMIQVMENTIGLMAQFQPLAMALPQVQDLVTQVNALKTGRGL